MAGTQERFLALLGMTALAKALERKFSEDSLIHLTGLVAMETLLCVPSVELRQLR
jgi:hypothetical protein